MEFCTFLDFGCPIVWFGGPAVLKSCLQYNMNQFGHEIIILSRFLWELKSGYHAIFLMQIFFASFFHVRNLKIRSTSLRKTSKFCIYTSILHNTCYFKIKWFIFKIGHFKWFWKLNGYLPKLKWQKVNKVN